MRIGTVSELLNAFACLNLLVAVWVRVSCSSIYMI